MPAGRPRRRKPSPEQAAAATAAREQRLIDLHRQLAEGVAVIRDGDSWADWLATAAKFHHYSFGNQLLIAAQKPDATLVAGYGAWRAMGRQVSKGEKALWILAPITRRGHRPDSEASLDGDDLTSPTSIGEAGDAARPASRGRVAGFKGAAVFDVSQTEGDPIPAPPRPQLLAGQAPPGLWDALAEAITARGFTVTRCPDAAAIGGANGVTDYTTRTVTVRADVDDAMACKTICHEAGHVLLHNPDDPAAEGPACRGLIEVEAESVAYLVAAHHDLDTADYTFAYIATWAGRDDQAVTSTASRVLVAARTLIEATDTPTSEQEATVAQLATQATATANTAQGIVANAEGTLATLTAARDRRPGLEDELRAITLATQRWFLTQAATSPVYSEAVTARGHTVAAATEYGVGYAPHSWTGLVDHLRHAGHRPEDLLAAGVATSTRHGRLIDRFRGRITFPIHDHLGVVGFTARDTTGNPDAPKYLNTPTTGLYDKGTALFGTQHLDDREGNRQPAASVVLVEGPWDALAVTAAADRDVVGLAACGTAVTEQHLDLVARGGRTLILGPDPDPAGHKSLSRTLMMLAGRGDPHPNVITTPPGMDLADLYATGGAAGVRTALAGVRPGGIVYAEALLSANHPTGTAEARVATARAAAAHIIGLTLRQRGQLGVLLTSRAGVTPDTALALVSPEFLASRTTRLPESRREVGVQAAFLTDAASRMGAR